jgi:hypothetical protein
MLFNAINEAAPMNYRYEDGQYVLTGDCESSSVRMKEVSLLYSQDDQGVRLLAHGDQVWIGRYLEQTRDRVKVVSLDGPRPQLKLMKTTTMSCSDLNKCITTGEYFSRLIRQREQVVYNEPVAMAI